MNNQFNFKYTAPSQEERKEIDSIRRQYAPQEKTETKLERLNVLFKNFLWFDIIERKGAKIMNTDKIYAERLASEYAPKTTRKIKALIRLDKWIKKPAFITAYIIGALSAVCFLVGFSLIVYNQLLIGTIMEILGLVGMSISPIVYKAIFNKRKNKNANDILLLTEELIIEDTFEQ